MTFVVAGMLSLLTTGCGGIGSNILGNGSSSSSTGNILGDVLGAMTNGETIGNVLGSVIGLDKISPTQLYGTWKYNGPGCAFTSNSALAKAGGEVVATQIEEKLSAQYAKLGLNANNTSITFNQDGTFSSKIGGRGFNGNYTYDQQTSTLKLQGMLLSLNGYVTRNGSGISVLFESKKLLTLMQTMATLSGNSTLSTIGDISKNYDGMRIGFDMNR